MGTLGGALEARGISAAHGKLTGEARGEVEVDDGVLVLRRIFVTYHLQAAAEHRDVVERVHGVHHGKCPVYRSIHRAIEVSTEYRLEPPAGAT